MADTVAFSEKNKGWIHFDYTPDAMCRLNNRFFMIKDGQLHLAHDKDNPVRNNFFGVQYDSKIKVVMNQEPSEDKIFKTLVLEGNKPWSANIKTNYTESTLSASEFEEKESRQFAYLRKSEDDSDFKGGAVQGIGNFTARNANVLTFSDAISESISIGDKLMLVISGEAQEVGTITNIDGHSITVDSVAITTPSGSFGLAKKNSRIEGGEIRGYFMEVELTNSDTDEVELYAIGSNAVKSYI